VTGDVNPLSKDLVVNLTIDCKNVNLTPITPYMEKFAGYPLQRGKLLLGLHYDIAHSQLVASNHVVIAGLTLGARNNSPDATKLPVKLGVALLKDRSGNIALDVPLSGSISNPDFKIWPIVWQVVGNLLAKAATSPFTLLGALFGGGEEMSYVDFQPGLAAIPAAEQAKLDKLAKALYERPAVQVEIAAGSDPAADAPVLARLKLESQIRSMQASELIAAGTPPETVESMKVDPTNYARLLKALYMQTIGTNDTAAATNATPGAPPAGGGIAAMPATAAPTMVTNQPPQRGSYLFGPDYFVKGGEQMVRGADFATNAHGIAQKSPPAAVAKKPPVPETVPAGNSATNTPGLDVAPPADEPTQEQMEASLLAKIPISSDDLRALMQARARSVQAALVASGQVEGERLFILAPQPVSLNSQGQSRANLSLQ
jgi:hypothetical protein